MGIRHLAWALYDAPPMDPTAKLLLVAIADHINDETGTAYPSVTRLAGMVGVTRRNTLKWLDVLETAGVLAIDRTPGRPNVYRICTGVASDTTRYIRTGVASDTVLVSLATKTGVASDTRTIRTRKNRGRGTVTVPAPRPEHRPVADVLADLDALA